LSFAQQGLWFIDQLERESTAYNQLFAVHLCGSLNVAVLEQALTEIVRRHEVLRTTFKNVDGQPVQVIAPNPDFSLSVVDLSDLPEAKQSAEIQQLAISELDRPFNLEQLPLLRVTLLQLKAAKYVLLLAIHHIVADGWSGGIIIRELAALYEAFSTGKPSPLPPLPIQYADFASWEQQRLRGAVLEEQLTYWTQQLADAPPILQLPCDRPRPAIQTHRGATLTLKLGVEVTQRLKQLSQQEGATLFMTLLAAFQVLLYRYTNQDDICVGTTLANRHSRDLESLVGFFVNTAVMRTDLSCNPSFREVLGRVRLVALEAQERSDLPFNLLVEKLQPERNLSHTPLFQVMFVLENAPIDTLELAGLTISRFELAIAAATFDLSLSMRETPQGLIGNFEYNIDLFDAATITRMAGHFETLLTTIVANPQQHLSELPLLSEVERHQLLVEWNNTLAEYPDICIHQLFESQVEQTPNAVAVVFENEQLTYRQLNQRANQLAHYLKKLGVKSDVLVGICVERSLEMVVGLLGILKAGGAYVPLDPAYPQERLAWMLEDAQVSVLLTQQRLVAMLPPTQAQVICLDTDWDEIAVHNPSNPSSEVTSHNLVYVIYTSGSTGTPKGAMNTHRGLSNRLLWMQDVYQLTTADRVLQKTPFSFDVSVWEFFWPLLCGARLVVAQPGGHQDSAYLAKLIASQQITTIHFVPSMLQIFLEEPSLGACNCLKRVICSGEALPFALQERFFARLDAQLHNLYGPTEASIDVTFWDCRRQSDFPIVPIGRPIANTQIYLLDRHLQPVPIGVPGELYIGGDGLARGYLNRPDLTSERFIPNPFSDKPGARLYKSGDLARYLPNGEIEYLGRIDHQVKVRGFRIELGEIEAVLSQHPGVRENVVLVREDERGNKRLVVYVVHQPEQAFTITELRRFLEDKLPEYMVPAVVVQLEALPLTPNGKVDRRALPAPDTARPELEKPFVAPRTEVEEQLAGIWSDVLGLEQIGVRDNFFELGGHSLLATQVVSRVREVFGMELPLRRLFESPTVAGLAEGIQVAMKAELKRNASPINRISRNGNLPLSFAQERLWLLEQLQPGSLSYHTPAAIRLDGSLDIAALEQALNEILRRHEVFRTTFSVVDGQPVQAIVPFQSVSLPVVNLGELPDAERSHKLQQLIAQWGQNLFDLAQAPLLRWMLLGVSEREHLLLLSTHHIVCDGWSAGVFVRELATLYNAFSQGQPSPLPELPIQYADFAIWQRQWLQGDVLETQLAYWKQQLGKIPPVLKLPTQHSSTQTSTGKQQCFTLSPTLTEALKTLCQQEGMTLFMTLLAAFKALLYRYSTQDDIVVGSPIANRNRSEIEELIGFFANTLVLRTNLSGNPSFRDVLKRVREVTLGAYAHQDLPFEKLVAELQPDRNLGQTPLYQVWFVLQNAPMPTVELPSLTLSFSQIDTGAVRHDLKLDLTETPEGLQGFFEYKTDLFETSAIARMAGLYETLLTTVVQQPDIQLNALLAALENAKKQQQLSQEEEFKTARRQKLGNIQRKQVKS
jgi:amino acid adenylation domain-containing protein